jgi:hypothetical protein
MGQDRNLAVNVVVCGASLVTLAVLALLVCFGGLRVSLVNFGRFRFALAVFVIGYAAYCIYRLATIVVLPRQGIPDSFVRELIAISIFWITAPPTWFFVEYYAADSGCIGDEGEWDEDDTKNLKNYADYASKIWAGVLALLLGLIALGKP